MDADELRDFEDQDPHIPPPSAADLGPYIRFLQNLSDIIPDVVYDILQAGLVPPLDKEAAGIITGSEAAIVKEFESKHSLTASPINDLIKDILKTPAFNKDE